MKILNIIQCSNLGGMEQSTLESMTVLKEAGHDVRMVSLHPVGALKALAESRGIPLVDIPGRYRAGGMANVRGMLRLIKQYRPDRIWLTGHNFGSLTAAALSGCPAYLSIHYHHCERPAVLWILFYGLAKRICSGIRFISRYIHDEVAQYFKRGGAVCFPNIFRAPDAVPDRTEARDMLGLPAGAFIVGNAGWLIPRKAFDVFLQTAALVSRQVPEVVFVIAGDGSEREKLEALVNELEIGSAVRFIGWQKDLSPFYGALDVLLFNSNFDALGRTPVEALCHGVPVVASVTHGGLSEFIRPGRDGFLIDHHDPEALAEEIIRLRSDPAYRNACALSGQTRVLEMGSPEKHLEHLTRLMEL